MHSLACWSKSLSHFVLTVLDGSLKTHGIYDTLHNFGTKAQFYLIEDLLYYTVKNWS